MISTWTFLCTAWLAAADQPPRRFEPSPQAPPAEVLEWTSSRGKPYWYRLPRRLDARKPPALILMLHGTGLKWGWAFWNYPIAAGRFRAEDIVVAPEGMTPGNGDTFNFIQGKSDGDHLAELITSFKKKLPVGKVYLYGHSQGAFFCYWFVGEHPDLVDGIVAHAGNVLTVKHPKLAKDKVAIGILHGKADQVVPVDCAYRTEKIYREQGYRQVKLNVVEGLTEQSGHWPLPKQVGEMLAWLDVVTADSPGLVLASVLHALDQQDPDLVSVAEGVVKAEIVLKAWKGKDRPQLQECLEALRKFLEEAAREHGKEVEAGSKALKGEAQFGPWAAHFRHAHRALEGLPAWQKAASGTLRRAAGQEKGAARAWVLLEQAGAKALGEALKSLESGFLASRYEELLGFAERIAQGQGARAEDRKKVEELISSRKTPWEAGLKAALDIDRKLARAFREAHSGWFKELEGGGGASQ